MTLFSETEAKKQGSRKMDYKKASSVIADAIESTWLNLHEGNYDDEASEIANAQKLTAIVPSERIEWASGLTKNPDPALIDIAKTILDIASEHEGNHFLGYVVRKDT